MIRVGRVGWFFNFYQEHIRGSEENRFVLELISEYKSYIVPTSLRDFIVRPLYVHPEPTLPIKIVSPKPIRLIFFASKFNNKDILFNLAKAVKELAIEVVGECVNNGLVCVEVFQKQLAIKLCERYFTKRIQDNLVSEPINQLEDINLHNLLEQERREEEARLREEMRLIREEQEARYREYREKDLERQKRANESLRKSFELLDYMLPPEQKENMKKGYLKIERECGTFFIPTKYAHGLVQRFENGIHVENLCVQFKNWEIPVGDEILMKYLFIKEDVETFIKVANRTKIGRKEEMPF
jgi:hypothetical protein